MQTIEFYFDFGSPYSYIAYHQLNRYAQMYDINIIYHPIILGAVFKATNNNSPAMVPHKARYLVKDLADCSKYWQIPFVFNPYFPVNTFFLMRAAVGFQTEYPKQFDLFVSTIFKAMFEQPVNLNDENQVKQVLEDGNISFETYQQLINNEQIKERAKTATQAAVDRGIFGAPTFFIHDEMFWGQDRLHFIEQYLKS